MSSDLALPQIQPHDCLIETLAVDQAVGGFRFLLWTKLLLVPGLGKPPLKGRSRDTPPDDFSPVGRPVFTLGSLSGVERKNGKASF